MVEKVYRLRTLVRVAVLVAVAASSGAAMLFPTNLPQSKWVEFKAAGFSKPVSGVIYRTDNPPSSGMPLGCISTGCLDIEGWGVYGYSSIFCPYPRLWIGDWNKVKDFPDPWYASPFHPYPTSPRSYQPFLGISSGGKVCVLVSKHIRAGGYFADRGDDPAQRVAPAICDEITGVKCASEIHYWGHYPVVDMEYDTDTPVRVSLRAWTPFIPGDPDISNTPGAVFEVHLRNRTKERQRGKLVFSFPGPSQAEAQIARDAPVRPIHVSPFWTAAVPVAAVPVSAERRRIQGVVTGLSVSSPAGVNYCLGTVGDGTVCFGGGLSAQDWAKIPAGLPQPVATDFSASLAVDFDLPPEGTKVIPIVLSWYAPIWYGEGPGNIYTQKYSERFKDSTAVAELLASEGESLLKRVLAWQQVIYAEKSLPPWLKDVLINTLGTIPETSFWSLGKDKLSSAGEDGLFAQMECARGTPQLGTTPTDFYGSLPILYFFPELARNTLRAYTRSIRDDGATPINLGWSGNGETYDIHKALNGVCFAALADRVWQASGDDEVLRECYPAVKRSTSYTMTLRPGPEGIISIQEPGGTWQHWWEQYAFYGMTSHVGALHLADLRIAERMAEKMGDSEFARKCRRWLEQGNEAMEKHLWNGEYYRMYNDPKTGNVSDLLMASQLDGEWIRRFEGTGEILPSNRVSKTLDTVQRLCLDDVVGALPFVTPDGNLSLGPPWAYANHILVPYAIFPVENTMLGMTYLYHGRRETGLKIIERNWYNLVCRQGHAWELPNMVQPYTGRTAFGTEYYQNLIVWAVPAAIERKDIKTFCASGGLVDRILKAARKGK